VSWVLALLGVGFLYLNFKDRKRIDATVHINEQTEEAERLDFAIALFSGESAEEWERKMEKFYSLAERRRAHNNKRLMDEHQKRLAEIEQIKKEREQSAKTA
jgi:hypothetical protein